MPTEEAVQRADQAALELLEEEDEKLTPKIVQNSQKSRKKNKR